MYKIFLNIILWSSFLSSFFPFRPGWLHEWLIWKFIIPALLIFWNTCTSKCNKQLRNFLEWWRMIFPRDRNSAHITNLIILQIRTIYYFCSLWYVLIAATYFSHIFTHQSTQVSRRKASKGGRPSNKEKTTPPLFNNFHFIYYSLNYTLYQINYPPY